MTTLIANAKWWEDGSPVNLLIENGIVRQKGTEPAQADETVDAEGRYLMPSFVEPHAHILPLGFDLKTVSLRDCKSKHQLLDVVRNENLRLPDGEWLLASQYDANKFDDGQDVTAADLDRAAPERPVILRHASGHACVVNSVVLRYAEIATQQDPPGGTVVRDERGRPTGVLLESAMAFAYRRLPRASKSKMRDAILAAGEEMHRFGIAVAADMQTGHGDLQEELDAYRSAADEGCKIWMRLYLDWEHAFEDKGVKSHLREDDRLRISGIKLFADGAIGPATAAIHGTYNDGQSGNLIYEPDELFRRIRIAEQAGYRVAIHSIGDRSTDVVLDCLSRCQNPSRHRIEHAMMLSEQQMDRISTLGIKVCVQPAFLKYFAHAYKKRLGERFATLKPVATMLKKRIRIAFSSDAPIVPCDPMEGIRTAVNCPEGFDPTENVDIKTAYSLYTRGASELLGEEERFGCLEPGQFAHFRLLETNPLQ